MEDQFDLYLDRLNVQDILYYAGYRLNKRDGLRYPSYVRLDDEGRRIRGDKFICMPGSKTCFKPPVIKSYNVISLITSFPELFAESGSHKGADLVDTVCRRILNMPDVERNTQVLQPQNQKPFDLKDYKVCQFQRYNSESYKHFMPYLRERGLSTSTLQAFGKDILVTQKNTEGSKKSYTNLSFPLTIPGKKDIVGLEERGRARLDGTSGYKGKALGSNGSEGMWISSPNNTELKNAKHVLWFESGYDAMAFYQILAGPKSQLSYQDKQELNNAVFISTGGNPTVMQFRGVIKEAQNASHHLGFDNDLAGKQYVKNFQTVLQQLREEMPKVGPDMKEYMATVKNGAYLKGDTDLLPDDLRHAFDKYYDEAEELLSMQECGLSAPEDIHDQKEKVSALLNDWKKMMKDKLCIGREDGPLKDLGTYDIPEWALYAMENGDFEGVTEEEEFIFHEFFDKHFPDGFVHSIDWDNPNEFNVLPAFGTRNPNALTSHGESLYQAVKTYPVQFLHPTEREAYVLPNIKVIREEPNEGCKDFNDQLKKQIAEERAAEEQDQEETKESAGLDMDADGDVELNECDERKHRHGMAR